MYAKSFGWPRAPEVSWSNRPPSPDLVLPPSFPPSIALSVSLSLFLSLSLSLSPSLYPPHSVTHTYMWVNKVLNFNRGATNVTMVTFIVHLTNGNEDNEVNSILPPCHLPQQWRWPQR